MSRVEQLGDVIGALGLADELDPVHLADRAARPIRKIG